jgi:hypothetical protein
LAVLGSQRIQHLKKGKPGEIRIPRANSSYSMLAHENGRVCVMEKIAGEVRQLRNDDARDLGMPGCRKKDRKPWCGEQSRHEAPRGGRT